MLSTPLIYIVGHLWYNCSWSIWSTPLVYIAYVLRKRWVSGENNPYNGNDDDVIDESDGLGEGKSSF